jgi:hypothetical protein
MNTKFKRHQKVKLLRDPDKEYIEYHEELIDDEDSEEDMPAITKGMKGRINLILPNGQYHVEIFDSKGNPIAYCEMPEEDLEAV